MLISFSIVSPIYRCPRSHLFVRPRLVEIYVSCNSKGNGSIIILSTSHKMFMSHVKMILLRIII